MFVVAIVAVAIAVAVAVLVVVVVVLVLETVLLVVVEVVVVAVVVAAVVSSSSSSNSRRRRRCGMHISSPRSTVCSGSVRQAVPAGLTTQHVLSSHHTVYNISPETPVAGIDHLEP